MGAKGFLLKTSAIAAFGLFSLQASAAIVTFYLDYEFSGAQQPQGPTPWATATIEDTGLDKVTLTMETTNLVDSEFVSEWYFNFSGDATQLSFTPVDTADATVNGVLTDNTNSNAQFKADGDGFFDIKFDFAPPPGNPTATKFTGGETIVYDITLAGISASDFNMFSAPGGGNGAYLSAAHVQSISDTGYCDGSTPDLTGACGSGWIGAVPVPAAVWLFGSGLLGLVGVARRKRA
jgi:hypothetical protein